MEPIPAFTKQESGSDPWMYITGVTACPFSRNFLRSFTCISTAWIRLVLVFLSHISNPHKSFCSSKCVHIQHILIPGPHIPTPHATWCLIQKHKIPFTHTLCLQSETPSYHKAFSNTFKLTLSLWLSLGKKSTWLGLGKIGDIWFYMQTPIFWVKVVCEGGASQTDTKRTWYLTLWDWHRVGTFLCCCFFIHSSRSNLTCCAIMILTFFCVFLKWYNHWTDCHEIWYKHPWSPEDEPYLRWWSCDISSSATSYPIVHGRISISTG